MQALLHQTSDRHAHQKQYQFHSANVSECVYAVDALPGPVPFPNYHIHVHIGDAGPKL